MKDPYARNWFSNFSFFDRPFSYQGCLFYCVETFYQAMKTEDLAERTKISAMRPNHAKKYGKTLKIRADWEEIKLDVMEYILRYKFQKGTTWHKKLVDTKEEIIESNLWHDNFWGTCYCTVLLRSSYGRGPNCGQGSKNHLGKLLTKIRDEFLNQTND